MKTFNKFIKEIDEHLKPMAPPTDKELDAYYKNWCKDHPNHKDCEEYNKGK